MPETVTPADPTGRVLLVHSSAGRYGADRQLALIARALPTPPVVVLPQHGPLADDLVAAGAEVVLRPGLAVLRRELLSLPGLARLSAALAADGRWLSRLIRARSIALVHSNTSVVLAGAAGARLGAVPHVWHVREIYSRWGRAWPAHRALLVRAAAVPCVSAATTEQFAGHGADRVCLVPDGIASVPLRAQREVARAALGLPADPAAIAVLGRVSDWKGQDVLIRALACAELAEIGAIGLIAGDAWPGAPERLEAVRALARSLGVADRVHFLGFREEIGDVLGAAEVVAVPSTAPDPLPNAALEAAAAGCAVVASAHGGLPEIIRDGRTGRLVAPDDPRALAGACRELIDAPAERRALGEAAAEDVCERFAPERLGAAVRALHQDVLAAAAAPRGRRGPALRR